MRLVLHYRKQVLQATPTIAEVGVACKTNTRQTTAVSKTNVATFFLTLVESVCDSDRCKTVLDHTWLEGSEV